MANVAASETSPQIPKLTAHTSHERARVSTSGAPATACVVDAPIRRGRRINSPPQRKHTFFSSAAHAEQYVHSNEQMYASPPGGKLLLHLSQRIFISRCIGNRTSRKPEIGPAIFNHLLRDWDVSIHRRSECVCTHYQAVCPKLVGTVTKPNQYSLAQPFANLQHRVSMNCWIHITQTIPNLILFRREAIPVTVSPSTPSPRS